MAKRMKRLILGALTAFVAIFLAAVILVCSGAYSIGVTNHDSRFINGLLATGMIHSVRHHAKGTVVPPLADPALLRMGFGHYDEMCVSCHGAPGIKPDEISEGLWPKAPDLTKPSRWSEAELFWIIKNGIKFTAMPAWGPTHNDHMIWAMVAFVEKLPQTTPAQYQLMKAADKGEHREE